MKILKAVTKAVNHIHDGFAGAGDEIAQAVQETKQDIVGRAAEVKQAIQAAHDDAMQNVDDYLYETLMAGQEFDASLVKTLTRAEVKEHLQMAEKLVAAKKEESWQNKAGQLVFADSVQKFYLDRAEEQIAQVFNSNAEVGDKLNKATEIVNNLPAQAFEGVKAYEVAEKEIKSQQYQFTNWGITRG